MIEGYQILNGMEKVARDLLHTRHVYMCIYTPLNLTYLCLRHMKLI